MNEEDKQLLRETYLNTVKNSSTVSVKGDEEKTMKTIKKNKKVNFQLQDNVTYEIPYYSKNLFYNDWSLVDVILV